MALDQVDGCADLTDALIDKIADGVDEQANGKNVP